MADENASPQAPDSPDFEVVFAPSDDHPTSDMSKTSEDVKLVKEEQEEEGSGCGSKTEEVQAGHGQVRVCVGGRSHTLHHGHGPHHGHHHKQPCLCISLDDDRCACVPTLDPSDTPCTNQGSNKCVPASSLPPSTLLEAKVKAVPCGTEHCITPEGCVCVEVGDGKCVCVPTTAPGKCVGHTDSKTETASGDGVKAGRCGGRCVGKDGKECVRVDGCLCIDVGDGNCVCVPTTEPHGHGMQEKVQAEQAEQKVCGAQARAGTKSSSCASRDGNTCVPVDGCACVNIGGGNCACVQTTPPQAAETPCCVQERMRAQSSSCCVGRNGNTCVAVDGCACVDIGEGKCACVQTTPPHVQGTRAAGKPCCAQARQIPQMPHIPHMPHMPQIPQIPQYPQYPHFAPPMAYPLLSYPSPYPQPAYPPYHASFGGCPVMQAVHRHHHYGHPYGHHYGHHQPHGPHTGGLGMGPGAAGGMNMTMPGCSRPEFSDDDKLRLLQQFMAMLNLGSGAAGGRCC